MILSRGNLLIVDTTRVDKDIPALDAVHIRGDGSTVATNGLAVVTVSPVNEERRKQCPLDETPSMGDITIPAETIKDVLKHMPKDSQFRGILEHCDFNLGKFTFTDGKRKSSLEGKTYPRKYVPYKLIFENAYQAKTETRVAINLKRLLATLETIDTICSNSSKDAIVYLEFTKDNDIIVRSENQITKQRAIAVMSSYKGSEGKWMELSEWEKTMFSCQETTQTSNCDSLNNEKPTQQHKKIPKVKRVSSSEQSTEMKSECNTTTSKETNATSEINIGNTLRDINLKLKAEAAQERAEIHKLKQSIRAKKQEAYQNDTK
jgi:hypothetical protein